MWKMREWTPVFKKGDKTNRGNYQPITVLNSIKILKSLISKQIMKTMDPHLNQKTSGHRKTHSCEITLIRLTEEWKMAANNKEYVTVLYTNISKAFDFLHPALMIQKLKAYGSSKLKTYSELLTRASLLSWYQQQFQNITNFTYKVRKGLCPLIKLKYSILPWNYII